MTDLNAIQQTELAILKDFKRVCEKHGIPYYMAQGTLLGAVRHGGFIPWDDDIDVLMPAEDMVRFVKAYQSDGEPGNFVTNYHIEPYYYVTWTKVRKTETTSMPKKYMDIPVHWGICMDVFPYFGVSDNGVLRKLEVLSFKMGRKLLMATMTPYDENVGRVSRLLEKIPLKGRIRLADMFFSVLKRHLHKKTAWVLVTCKGAKIMPRRMIEGDGKPAYLPFEDEAFATVADHDAFLCDMFGDYMTPPPESERRGHDLRIGEIIWDTEKGFAAYKQELKG